MSHPALSNGPLPQQGGVGGSDASVCRGPLSAEEKRNERERLQDMVKEFTKAVVQGQQCQWVPSITESPRRATYSFDKALRSFSLHPDGGPVVCLDMLRICEVVKDVRETPFSQLERLPPPHEV